jgi:hypothetical protein
MAMCPAIVFPVLWGSGSKLQAGVRRLMCGSDPDRRMSPVLSATTTSSPAKRSALTRRGHILQDGHLRCSTETGDLREMHVNEVGTRASSRSTRHTSTSLLSNPAATWVPHVLQATAAACDFGSGLCSRPRRCTMTPAFLPRGQLCFA